MGESLHVQKLEAPFKRSIRAFKPGQDLYPVPHATWCELSKFQTELDSVVQSSRTEVRRDVSKTIRNTFFSEY